MRWPLSHLQLGDPAEWKGDQIIAYSLPTLATSPEAVGDSKEMLYTKHTKLARGRNSPFQPERSLTYAGHGPESLACGRLTGAGE